jgi:uncharacterized protein YndB with AHSA1/START domain
MDRMIDPTGIAPGPLAEVTVHADGDRWTLVFVRDLEHPPEKVWGALTDPDQLARWAPYTADRDLAATGPATLTMLDAGEPGELPPAEVIWAQAPVLLEYTWGGDLLRWELAPTGLGTRLTLRHTVASREFVSKVAAGWHLCIMVADRLLDGAPIGPIRGQDAVHHGWQELESAYDAALQVE